MVKRRVLVVEDDPVIGQMVAERLQAEAYDVRRAHDGPGGVAAAAEHRPDLVVLDVMLPGYDGLEVCRRIHAGPLGPAVPVLMLTARDDEADVLTGLGVGADDYLTKPFRMRELVARVAALLRRVERAEELARSAGAAAADGDAALQVAGLAIEVGARRVLRDGVEVHLTPTEFDLLLCLVQAGGDVLTREHLLARVWGWSAAAGSTRTVDSHVKALRAKIGGARVRTVHGVGYALDDTGAPA